LLPTTAVIGLACLGMIIWTSVCWRLLDAALLDRENAMRRKQPVSPGDMAGLRGFVVRRALEAYGPAGVRVGDQADAMNMFAQAQGAFAPSARSMSPMPGYPGASSGDAAYDQKMSRELGYANPVMARETSEAGYSQANNPMFVQPGASAGAPTPAVPGRSGGVSLGSWGAAKSGHTSIDV